MRGIGIETRGPGKPVHFAKPETRVYDTETRVSGLCFSHISRVKFNAFWQQIDPFPFVLCSVDFFSTFWVRLVRVL